MINKLSFLLLLTGVLYAQDTIKTDNFIPGYFQVGISGGLSQPPLGVYAKIDYKYLSLSFDIGGNAAQDEEKAPGFIVGMGITNGKTVGERIHYLIVKMAPLSYYKRVYDENYPSQGHMRQYVYEGMIAFAGIGSELIGRQGLVFGFELGMLFYNLDKTAGAGSPLKSYTGSKFSIGARLGYYLF